MQTIIDPNQLEILRKEVPDLKLLDVRSPGEFESSHIEGAFNIAVEEMPKFVDELTRIEHPMVLICRSGTRAKKAREILEKEGLTQLHLLEGGMVAWEKAGKPVQVGKRNTLPLDRQMRIAAGSMVAIGSLLTLFVNKDFAAIPMFVGCGLVYAGITDHCPATSLLAKLPWNKSENYDCTDVVCKLTGRQ